MNMFKKKRDEKLITETLKNTVNCDNAHWCLFKFYDSNTRRWSPVYCAFSVNAAQDEMSDMIKKFPKRAFLFQTVGEIDGGELKVAPTIEKLYIGEEYEDIG